MPPYGWATKQTLTINGDALVMAWQQLNPDTRL